MKEFMIFSNRSWGVFSGMTIGGLGLPILFSLFIEDTPLFIEDTQIILYISLIGITTMSILGYIIGRKEDKKIEKTEAKPNEIMPKM